MSGLREPILREDDLENVAKRISYVHSEGKKDSLLFDDKVAPYEADAGLCEPGTSTNATQDAVINS